MGIGCSDTYSVSNNASQYYLGPRKEVNPYLGTWEACGSFFDEPISPDGDCGRDYSGSEPNGVNHRLEVWDADLGHAGATYYYEGVYYVADDGLRSNNIGWRQCTTTWSGSQWNITTTGAGLVDNQGTVIDTWGDLRTHEVVAADDGEVILAVRVTDLGGGSWHYEYALYNWFSDRGVYSFTIPVGGAAVSSIGFHDVDKIPGNDWTAVVAGGFVTWSTSDYVTDPNANAVTYQTMYNFRFDSNVPPVAGQAQCGIFKPGIGTSFFADTNVPDGGAVAVGEVAGAASGLALGRIEPNPFGSATRISFSLPQRGHAKLTVFDVTGRVVRVLVDDEAPAGTRVANWDGRDASGRSVASGIYLVRLESADGARTAKVARLR
jgi:hypothetical protein